LKKHGKNYHINGTVFLSAHLGQPMYIHKDSVYEQESIFVDFLGNCWENKDTEKAYNYKLKPEKWEKIKRNILENNIFRVVLNKIS
jgi:hypothetical protein